MNKDKQETQVNYYFCNKKQKTVRVTTSTTVLTQGSLHEKVYSTPPKFKRCFSQDKDCPADCEVKKNLVNKKLSYLKNRTRTEEN